MNKFKNKSTKRVLAALLTFMMVVSILPSTVFAASDSNPNTFTVFVKDSKGTAINDANVNYEIKDGEIVIASNEIKTDENGYAVIAEIEEYSDKITNEGSTISIRYSVSKIGYKTIENNNVIVSDANGNIDVTMLNNVPDTVNVSVSKTGSGTVTINNVDNLDTTPVTKDSEISLEIKPIDIDGGRSYIKSLTIGTDNISVDKFEKYNNTLKITEDTKITVEFATEFTVEASTTIGGTIKLNDNEGNTLTIDKGNPLKILVVPDSGYEISSITIGGVDEIITDRSKFSKDIIVDKNVSVSATFVKLYKITVTYDNTKGTVVTDPSCEGGQVFVQEGKEFKIIAKPSDNYRVSKVIKNTDETIEYSDNGKDYEEIIYTLDKDYSYEFIFAPNTYKVTSTVMGNGTIKIENDSINYGESTKITLIPNNNSYRIGKISRNGIEINKESENQYIEQPDGSAVYTLENITEDTVIEAFFEEIPVVDGDWKDKISIAPKGGELIRSYNDIYGNEVYVYSNKTELSITAKTPYDRVDIKLLEKDNYEGWTKERTISSTSTIEVLQVKTRNKRNEETINLNNKKIILVIDKNQPEVTLTPESSIKENIYNKDVEVKIDIEEVGQYSGIKSIDYYVVKDNNKANPTQQDNLYTYNKENSTESDIINEWSGYITVESEKNNSSYVTVYVKTVDNAGNVNTQSISLDIDTTAPEIQVVYNNNKDNNGNAYFNDIRTATISIKERSNHFDSKKATEGIIITAVDSKGNYVEIDTSKMISEWTTTEGETPDDAIHTATIEYLEYANYTFTISYTDEANNVNDSVNTGNSVAPFEFTVDRNKPTGTITIDTNTWKKLLEKITFGLYSSDSVNVKATSEDLTSPTIIEYYKTSNTSTMTREELDKESFTPYEKEFEVKANEQFVVYLKITDYAGNYNYISSDGYIVDDVKSNIELIPVKQNENGIYYKDVEVKVNVEEPGLYSGIKSIDYWIIKDNDGNNPTQQGNLFTFNNESPSQKDLINKWTDSITVKSKENNSSNVILYVKTIDNAGNENTESIPLDIDITAPEIKVEYNNNKDNNGNTYFKNERTATISIKERSNHFDTVKATEGIVITAVDSNGKDVEIDTSKMISEWTTTEGETPDDAVHTATIEYLEDANYTFAISYTDEASNKNNGVNTWESVAPYKFTVDKTEPTGTITVGKDTWKEILEKITFGLYSNDSVNVKATSEDLTSPTVIEYYKTSETTAMTTKELDKESFVTYKEDFEVEANEQFVVYLKITDYAGNYTYISSDGYIVDDVKSNIKFTPDKPNENGIYNGDVEVKVNVKDPEPYSGIKSIDYYIVKDNDEDNPTQQGNLFTFDNKNPIHSELCKERTELITVKSEKNNSSNVIVYVKTVDNAGNENIESIPLDIDITAPEIRVEYDNNKDNNGNTYFDKNRTATISIKERSNHFNAEEATKGIVITAVDSKGKDVKIDTSKMISEWTTTEGNTPDDAIHTATIKYLEDANYNFAISYTDKAGNKNNGVNTGDSVAPYKFTVDKNVPSGTIKAVSEEGRETTWDELVDSLTFGFWSGKKISLTGTSDDATSPIESVEYYKTDSTKALKESEISLIKDWKVFDGLSVVPNEQFTVYLKITDKAGNVSYISTDGMIADNTSPREETIAPEITATPEQPINGIYSKDVKVSIKVDDPLVSGTYSGLKTVSYRVLNMGVETQSGTLYSFEKENPSHNDLLKTWTGDIVVDSKKNNSNDVVIEVYAEDNSLNSSKDKVSIKIDITEPTIDIKYNNNSADSQKYYKEDRVATIVVTERNFKAEDVKILITNTEGVIPVVSEWNQVPGNANGDNTTHTATINYKADGDYTFKIEYTDLAGNKCEEEKYEVGTTNPKEFTVDKTLPEMSVSYNNNGAQNGKYFKANRTATIVVKEHNFDVNRVEFTQTASKNGVAIAVPSASWSSNGDVHTATISYNADGDYTFDVKMKDMAGNNSLDTNYGNSAAAKDFTIDTDISEPEISGVENGKAYKDEVIPVIKFSDINYSDYKVQLIRTSMSDKNVDVTEDFIKTLNVDEQGGSGANDTFKKEQENDGIYTLYVKVSDKAGNESEKTVTFTVNRFGSVYEYSDYLMSLIENGGAYIKGLDQDLIITEYNADKLLDDSLVIEITHDGKPIEDIKYTSSPEVNSQVEIGSSGWFQYQYTISKENFTKDGVYKMSIASKDATGNIPENTNYKDKSILFRVDSTAPELTSVVGLEKSIINSQELTVKYTVFDTIALKSIKVYVDGEQQGDEIKDFSADVNNYSGSFVINESNSAQNVQIVIEDMAGNITDTSSEEFTSAYVFEKSVIVSTNTFVRWYANKILFWSSIVGSLVLAAGIWYTIYGKKKKEIEIEENK